MLLAYSVKTFPCCRKKISLIQSGFSSKLLGFFFFFFFVVVYSMNGSPGAMHDTELKTVDHDLCIATVSYHRASDTFDKGWF